MKHYGDITKIDGSKVEIVDVVCGGSPCQDLSIAGKRAGLDGERSGLFMEQIRIVKEMRDASIKELKMRGADFSLSDIKPRFMVWENVCGALSSPGKKDGQDHRGEDFQAVLTEIVRVVEPNAPDVPLPKDRRWAKSGCLMGYGADGQPFSIAYRVHDAQFWGVPQRRKRIALVADFRGTTAPEILFEREGLSRDTEQGEPQREETPGVVRTSADTTSYTLKVRGGAEIDSSGKKAGKGALVQTELSGTLGVSQDQTLIKVYGMCSYDSNSMKSANPDSGVYEADTSRTLDLNGGNPACNQGGMMVVEGVDAYNQTTTGDKTMAITGAATDAHHIPCVVLNDQGGQQMDVSIEQTGTLRAAEHGHQPLVLDKPIYAVDQGGGKPQCVVTKDVAPTLATTHSGEPVICHEPIVTSHGGFMTDADNSGIAHTLQATDYKDPQLVCYGLDRASFNQGQNAKYDFAVEEELSPTLVAKGPGGVLTQLGRYAQEITKE